LAAEGAVGGVFSVIHSRLLESGSGPLVELVNPLMSMILLPYLGPAAARSELERPVAAAVTRLPGTSRNPLRDLEMRLTYRTVRVLVAVASNPRSSNRAIGQVSGIGDQGQISKLLARMERLGLIENRGVAPARGEPNAWKLTQRGGEVHDALAARSSVA
jgi:DNA-binding MarR family transcriptional regulator